MSAKPNEIVSLCLLTQDSALVDDFVKGLIEQGLDNTVHHVTSGARAFDFMNAQATTKPYLVLLDIRAPNTNARTFLAEASLRNQSTPPIVIVIADRDDEMAITLEHKNMVAGRISSIDPAEDFIKLVDVALSSNWALEAADEMEPVQKGD